MHMVDSSGVIAKYMADPARKIPVAHLKTVCLKVVGKEPTPDQCRYVGTTPFGCFCAKNTPIRGKLDEIVSKSTGGARGDNCPGFGADEKSVESNDNRADGR